jgi:hypothetical protein
MYDDPTPARPLQAAATRTRSPGPRRARVPWTNAEKLLLQREWGACRREIEAKIPGRGYLAICRKAVQLGLGPPKQGRTTVKEVARVLGIHVTGVLTLAADLGLQVNKLDGTPKRARRHLRRPQHTVDVEVLTALLPARLACTTVYEATKSEGIPNYEAFRAYALHQLRLPVRTKVKHAFPVGWLRWIATTQRGTDAWVPDEVEQNRWAAAHLVAREYATAAAARIPPPRLAPWVILSVVYQLHLAQPAAWVQRVPKGSLAAIRRAARRLLNRDFALPADPNAPDADDGET